MSPAKRKKFKQNMLPPASLDDVTKIDGVGLWKAWEKTFDSPLSALLEIMDNAVDACKEQVSLLGREEGEYDEETTTVSSNQSRTSTVSSNTNSSRKPTILVMPDEIQEKSLMIFNSCGSAPPKMSDILKLYKSDKAESEIGQNGIGIKQGAYLHMKAIRSIASMVKCFSHSFKFIFNL